MGLPCGMPRGAALGGHAGMWPGLAHTSLFKRSHEHGNLCEISCFKKKILCRIEEPLLANGLLGHFVMSGIK